MDSRTARERTPTPEAIEFVRFCYRRRKVGWPEIYDEMCAVTGRGLFRGWDSEDLGAQGIGLSLFELPTLAALVSRVIAEEHERRDRLTTAEIVRASHAASPAMASGDAQGAPSDPPSDVPEPVGARRFGLARVPAGA